MQGVFTVSPSETDKFTRVTYYLDDQVLGEVLEPPFTLQFSTDDYPLGAHRIAAVGYTKEAGKIQSNILQVQFVSSGEGWQAAMDIIIPMIVLILGAIGLAFLVPFIFTRGRKEKLPLGAQRNYGYYGGAICPKCTRPFSRHVYGLNLGVGKFDRCPYCGKWSMVKRSSIEELRAAEAAELNNTADDSAFKVQLTDEERFNKEVEDSRYEEF